MQEISGRQEDIVFDLEQIKLLTQQKDILTDNEKDALRQLPLKKRKVEKEELLAQKKRKRKEHIRIWIVEVEEKVRSSNLPPEIKGQIIEMTTYAKERDIAFMYSVEEKINQIKTQIKEAEEKEEKRKINEAVKATAEVAINAIVLATVTEIGIEAYKEVHPEWYHVQYTPEKLKQTSIDYFDHTITQEIAEMKLPIVAEKVYQKKQGSQYTRTQNTVAVEQEKDIIDFAYQQAKQSAEQMGKKIPDASEFNNYWKKIPKVKKRAVQRKFIQSNPELAKKHEQSKLMADKQALEKGIERLCRKHDKKEAKMMKGISKRLFQAQSKETNLQILKAASQVTKSEERVREKAKAIPEKPVAKQRIVKTDFREQAVLARRKKTKDILKRHSVQTGIFEEKTKENAQKFPRQLIVKRGTIKIDWKQKKDYSNAA